MVLLLAVATALHSAIGPVCQPPDVARQRAVRQFVDVVNSGDAGRIAHYVTERSSAANSDQQALVSQMGVEHWKSHAWKIAALCAVDDSTVAALVGNVLSVETDSIVVVLADTAVRKFQVYTGVRVDVDPRDVRSERARVAALDRYLQRLHDAGVFDGIVVIQHGNRRAYERGFGRDRGRQITAATPFLRRSVRCSRRPPCSSSSPTVR